MFTTTTTNTLGVLLYFILQLRVHQGPEKKIALWSILSLPDEVLFQVLYKLDCWSILAARLTCKRFYTISQSPLLWRFKALEVSYSSGIPLLEEPVETYTSEELEEKIITRAQVCQRWRKLDPANFQWRKIDVGYRADSFYEPRLLPGGRWLLINLAGNVSIIDLDAPKTARQPLFDASSSMDPLNQSAIWIDPTKCWLSPRIALHCRNTLEQEGSSRICIYQLNSAGRSSGIKWSAEQLAIVHTSARGLKRQLQLNKEYVVERCMHKNGSDYIFKFYIYQYSDGPLRLCDCDHESKSTFLLLPQGRIGVITRTHIKISVISPVGSDGLKLEPILSTLLDPIDPISLYGQPFKLHSTFYHSSFKFATLDCMFEILFPHGTNEVYQKKIMFTNGPSHTSFIEGPSLLIRHLENYSVDFIFYGPEDGGPEQVASQICIPEDVFRTPLTLTACDVASGRLLTSRHLERVLLQV